MKKFLHGLTGVLLILLPFACGGMMVYANGFDAGLRDRLFAAIQGSPLYGIAAGLVLILIGLVYLGTYGQRRPKVKFISFDSEDGGVSISVNAVRDFIRRVGEEFGAVVSLEPKIRAEKDLISIDLDVKLQTGSRIPELSQVLQNRVRESIRDGLGIAEVREIKVRVQEIVGAPPPSRTR
ncbi:MAG: alkaline shock response membrane anchor protein AmaP [Kiritimatiellales bacterium]